MYGLDEPYNNNDLKQRELFAIFSDDCIKVLHEMKIVDSHKFYRKTDEEMEGKPSEKQIPKSGLFAYLISK